jgi:hypothetical protein
MTTTLRHGNDRTADMSLFRDGVEIFGWRLSVEARGIAG